MDDFNGFHIVDTNYIHKCKSYINTMLTGQQWSGINKSDIDRWIENFKDISEEERSIVYKLLSKLIYFSERDVENLLRDMIKNRLFSKIILEQQVKNDFQLSQKALQNIIFKEIEKSCFIPLLDSDSPHESGNYVNRLLVQKQIILTEQSFFKHKLIEKIQMHGYKRIVIVDDCIGSGQQITSFWNEETIIDAEGKEKLLKEWTLENNIEVFYLALFAYKETFNKLQRSLEGISVHCAILLDKELRVFEENSYMWDSQEEYEFGCEFLERITSENGIELKGYAGLDFAFIMHQTIPDWSLPLFWRENADWNCLLRRKNSNG